jgi:hypothetical protein
VNRNIWKRIASCLHEKNALVSIFLVLRLLCINALLYYHITNIFSCSLWLSSGYSSITGRSRPVISHNSPLPVPSSTTKLVFLSRWLCCAVSTEERWDQRFEFRSGFVKIYAWKKRKTKKWRKKGSNGGRKRQEESMKKKRIQKQKVDTQRNKEMVPKVQNH